MKGIERVIYWAEAAAWMTLISLLSGDAFSFYRTLHALQYWTLLAGLRLSEASLQWLHLMVRKMAHFGEFFILGLLLYRALAGGLGKFRPRVAIVVAVVCVVYSMGDEFRQHFTSFRTASLEDVGIDFAGAASALLLLYCRSAFSPGPVPAGAPRKDLAEDLTP